MVTTTENTTTEKIAALDTASICDANKGLRVLSAEIKCVTQRANFTGRAITVSCDDDFLSVLIALNQCKAGDVLVIAANGSQKAFAGELFTYEAIRRSLSAIIIDGFCRDVASISRLDFPVYARGSSPMAGTTKKISSDIGTTAVISGVHVSTGDILIGDKDGIVVLTEEELQSAIPIAESIQGAEKRILDKINEGISLFDLISFDEHVKTIQNGDESKLKFLV